MMGEGHLLWAPFGTESRGKGTEVDLGVQKGQLHSTCINFKSRNFSVICVKLIYEHDFVMSMIKHF